MIVLESFQARLPSPEPRGLWCARCEEELVKEEGDLCPACLSDQADSQMEDR